MRLFAALLRSGSTLWVGPLVVALALWYANRTAEYAPDVDAYLVEHTAAGADPLFLTLAVVAACAAWEGGRLRRAGWIGLPHARGPFLAAAPLWAPPLVVGLVTAAAGLLWKLHLGGVGLLPDLRFIPTLVIVVAALTLFGFAIGTRVPVVVAAPSVLIAIYLWMAIPGAISNPIWLRHLSGSKLGACCGLETDIDVRALLAPIVVSVGMIAASLLLLSARPAVAARSTAAAKLALLAGLIGGAVLAHDLPREPVTARSAEQLVCEEGTPRVCVWPEHRHFLIRTSALATNANAAWARYGVAVPREFTEALVAPDARDQRTFATWSGASDTELSQALALSMMPAWPACADQIPEDMNQPVFAGDVAYDYVLAWFEATAGLPLADPGQDASEDDAFDQSAVTQTVNRVRALPPEQQRPWLEHNLAALSSCDVLPQLEP